VTKDRRVALAPNPVAYIAIARNPQLPIIEIFLHLHNIRSTEDGASARRIDPKTSISKLDWTIQRLIP